MNILSHSMRIAGHGGQLFVQIWSPEPTPTLAPIILLHDSLGSVELWRGFPAALCAATGRPIIAYDRLGFGQSAPHPGALPLDFIAREATNDFAAVCQQLDIAQFILLGHSVGGGMAVHCAALHPTRCVALITESAQAFVEDRTIAGIETARTLFADAAQVERLKKYHGDKARWVLDAWINSWLHPDFADWSLNDVLPRVNCPTLVIHGADDEYGTARHPTIIANQVNARSQLEIIPATRHVPHREKEAEVLRTVREFVAKLA